MELECTGVCMVLQDRLVASTIVEIQPPEAMAGTLTISEFGRVQGRFKSTTKGEEITLFGKSSDAVGRIFISGTRTEVDIDYRYTPEEVCGLVSSYEYCAHEWPHADGGSWGRILMTGTMEVAPGLSMSNDLELNGLLITFEGSDALSGSTNGILGINGLLDNGGSEADPTADALVLELRHAGNWCQLGVGECVGLTQFFRTPPMTGNLLLTTYHLPLTTYHLPLTAYHLPLTTYHLPLTTYHLPLTTYYLRRTTYNSLLTTYYLRLTHY